MCFDIIWNLDAICTIHLQNKWYLDTKIQSGLLAADCSSISPNVVVCCCCQFVYQVEKLLARYNCLLTSKCLLHQAWRLSRKRWAAATGWSLLTRTSVLALPRWSGPSYNTLTTGAYRWLGLMSMILSSFSNSIISTQVSNMKMRKDKNRHWSYHAEVFTKGILRVSGKRRVDLNIRIVKDGVKDDREFLVYNSIFHQIKQYLSTKYANHSKVEGPSKWSSKSIWLWGP